MIDDTHAVLFSGLQHLCYLRARESECSVNHQPVWEHTNCSTISASPAISQCLRGRNPNNTTSVCGCMCAFYIILVHSMGVILTLHSQSWSSCIRNECLAKWAHPPSAGRIANLFIAQCLRNVTKISTTRHQRQCNLYTFPGFHFGHVLKSWFKSQLNLHFSITMLTLKLLSTLFINNGHVVSFIQFQTTFRCITAPHSSGVFDKTSGGSAIVK